MKDMLSSINISKKKITIRGDNDLLRAILIYQRQLWLIKGNHDLSKAINTLNQKQCNYQMAM